MSLLDYLNQVINKAKRNIGRNCSINWKKYKQIVNFVSKRLITMAIVKCMNYLNLECKCSE